MGLQIINGWHLTYYSRPILIIVVCLSVAGDGAAVEAAFHDDLPGVDDRRVAPLGAPGNFVEVAFESV